MEEEKLIRRFLVNTDPQVIMNIVGRQLRRYHNIPKGIAVVKKLLEFREKIYEHAIACNHIMSLFTGYITDSLIVMRNVFEYNELDEDIDDLIPKIIAFGLDPRIHEERFDVLVQEKDRPSHNVYMVLDSIFIRGLSRRCVDHAELIVKGVNNRAVLWEVGVVLWSLYKNAHGSQILGPDAERKTREVYARIKPLAFTNENGTLIQAEYICAVVYMAKFVKDNIRAWRSDELFNHIMRTSIHNLYEVVQRNKIEDKDEQVHEAFYEDMFRYISELNNDHPSRPFRRIN